MDLYWFNLNLTDVIINDYIGLLFISALLPYITCMEKNVFFMSRVLTQKIDRTFKTKFTVQVRIKFSSFLEVTPGSQEIFFQNLGFFIFHHFL